MTVLVVLMGVLFTVISQAGAVWRRTQNEVSSFQSARGAFHHIAQVLSQSRMAVYSDYDNATQPTAYMRKSDLHFVIDGPQGTPFGQGNSIFFQAPAGRTDQEDLYGGLPGMLNAMGYYVTYGKDSSGPAFLQSLERNRFRLMQYQAPAEAVSVQATADKSWYQNHLATYSEVLAENVILFLCWPRLADEEDPEGDDLTASYRYDSRLNASAIPQPVTAHQQPPLVQITMVVIDQEDASRLPDSAAPPEAITGALAGLFNVSTVAQYKSDLARLEANLQTAGIDYRIFSRTVPLQEAKWTK